MAGRGKAGSRGGERGGGRDRGGTGDPRQESGALGPLPHRAGGPGERLGRAQRDERQGQEPDGDAQREGAGEHRLDGVGPELALEHERVAPGRGQGRDGDGPGLGQQQRQRQRQQAELHPLAPDRRSAQLLGAHLRSRGGAELPRGDVFREAPRELLDVPACGLALQLQRGDAGVELGHLAQDRWALQRDQRRRPGAGFGRGRGGGQNVPGEGGDLAGDHLDADRQPGPGHRQLHPVPRQPATQVLVERGAREDGGPGLPDRERPWPPYGRQALHPEPPQARLGRKPQPAPQAVSARAMGGVERMIWG